MIEETVNFIQVDITDATPLPAEIDIPVFFKIDEVYVYEIVDYVATELEYETFYTLTGAGDPAGGTLTLLNRPNDGNSVLFVISSPDRKQLYNAIKNGKFSSDALNDALDNMLLQDQEQDRKTNLSVRGESHERQAWNTLPLLARAGKVLGFDATGQPYLPFTVNELAGFIAEEAPTIIAATPAGLGVSSSGRRVTVTWETTDAPPWMIFHGYPTGASATEALVLFAKGDAGSFTFIVPRDGDWTIYATGAEFGKLLSVPVLVGEQGVAMPTLAFNTPVGGAGEMTVNITPVTGYDALIQVYETGTTRYRTVIIKNASALVTVPLAPGIFKCRGWFYHTRTGELGPITTDEGEYTVIATPTEVPAGAAGTGGQGLIDVAWTAAPPAVYTQLTILNTTTGGAYTSGWLAPGSTTYRFTNLPAGTYTGTIRGIRPGVSESADTAFTITGAVTAGAVGAATGATIIPGANSLLVEYTPTAGVLTRVQINRNGVETYFDRIITNPGTQAHFIQLPAGNYVARLWNMDMSTGTHSAVTSYNNGGAFYAVTGSAGGTPDYTPAVPAAPTFTNIQDFVTHIEIVLTVDPVNWTLVELWRWQQTNPERMLWIAPGETACEFRHIQITGNYYVKASHWGPNGGVSTFAIDTNMGFYYYLISTASEMVEVANYAALPVTGVQGVIYITLNDGKTFRWVTEAYVEISSPITGAQIVTLVNSEDNANILTDAEKAVIAGYTVNAQTGTTYTMALTDKNRIVTLDNADPVLVTFPLDVFANGDSGSLYQEGAGLMSVKGATGVTLNRVAEAGADESLIAGAGQDKALSWFCVGTNSFRIVGGA